MANNRMFLVNKRTGHKIYLAKYYPSSGWYVPKDNLAETMNEIFDKADFGNLTEDKRRENVQSLGPVPHPSMGGTYGDEWELKYETDGIQLDAGGCWPILPDWPEGYD